MGKLIVYGASSSPSSLLCQQKELQDCRRLSGHCHHRRGQKRSSDPAGAGQTTEKLFLTNPASATFIYRESGRNSGLMRDLLQGEVLPVRQTIKPVCQRQAREQHDSKLENSTWPL